LITEEKIMDGDGGLIVCAYYFDFDGKFASIRRCIAGFARWRQHALAIVAPAS
jgi:hypothetical protein